MDGATETLFSFFDDAQMHGPVLFIGAREHPRLKGLDITLQQSFKPYVRALGALGLNSVPEIPVGLYETALVRLSKNVQEARYDTAKALSVLTEGGTLVCAGANDAGGKRALKMLEEFGLEDIREISGNKARAVGGRKGAMISEVRGILQKGALQRIEGGFLSQPGLFSWDRPDKGSEILMRELPEDLHGAGADFGCGYGYLAHHVLNRCKKIQTFTCIDADYRAVEACKKNLKAVKIPVQYLWEDLTQPQPGLRGLDFIVMNPPFHEGKKTDVEIGKAFIKRAAEGLKSGGELWAVANNRLPYERDMSEVFSKTETFYEGSGYKILRAVR